MAISEELQLDITRALAQVDAIERSMTQAFARAGSVGADAIASALGGQTFEVAIDVGADQAAAQVEEALSGTTGTVEVGADASAVPDEVEGALGSVDTEVPVTADASGVTASVNDALGAADTTVEVVAEVDTSGAQADIAALGSAASSGGADIAGMALDTERFAGIAAIASGSVGGLTHALGRSSTAVVGAGAALGALALTTKTFFEEALEADTATARYERTLGDLADTVEQIDVGGLNESISSLALRLGSSDDAIRNSVSSLFQLGEASGVARPKVAATAEQIVALAARAVAANPALGDVGDVADRLSAALARGGRFASQYGIALTSAEIEARALADTGKRSADELSLFEKSAAGAALATERFGSSLATTVDAGAATAEIRLRSIRQRFSEFIEGLGAPLIAPVLTLAEAIEKPGEDIAEVFGRMAEALIPLITAIAEGLVPALEGGADVAVALLDVLGPVLDLFAKIPAPVFTAVGAFLALRAAGLAAGLALDSLSVSKLATTLPALGSAAASASAGLLGMVPALSLIVAGTAATVGGIATLADHMAATHVPFKQFQADLAAFGAGGDAGAAMLELLGSQAEKLNGALNDLAAPSISVDHRRAVKLIDELDKSLADLVTSGHADLAAAALDRIRKALTPEAYAELVRNLGDYRQAQDDVASDKRLEETFAAQAAAAEHSATALDGLRGSQEANRVSAGNAAAVYRVLFDDMRTGVLSLGELDRAAVSLGVSQADITRFADAVTAASDAIVAGFTDKIPDAIGGLDAALGRLKEDFSLRQVIDDLNRQADEIAAFYDNVTRLTDAGFTRAAQVLLEKGPVAGARLAQLLADGDNKIRQSFETAEARLDPHLNGIEAKVRGLATRLPGITAEAADAVTAAFDKGLDLAGVSAAEAEQARRVLSEQLVTQQLLDAVNGEGGEVGDAFVAGLAAGISDGYLRVTDASKALVEAGILEARRVSGAQSPSRVFLRLGHDLVDGLVLGLQGGVGDATDAARRLMAATITGASGGSVRIPTATVAAPPIPAVALASPTGTATTAQVSDGGRHLHFGPGSVVVNNPVPRAADADVIAALQVVSYSFGG